MKLGRTGTQEPGHRLRAVRRTGHPSDAQQALHHPHVHDRGDAALAAPPGGGGDRGVCVWGGGMERKGGVLRGGRHPLRVREKGQGEREDSRPSQSNRKRTAYRLRHARLLQVLDRLHFTPLICTPATSSLGGRGASRRPAGRRSALASHRLLRVGGGTPTTLNLTASMPGTTAASGP